MNKKSWLPTTLLGLSLMMTLAVSTSWAEGTPASQPPLPDVPGITTPDLKPNACVDCHKVYPGKFDGRLTVALQSWINKTDDKLLALAQSTMPPGIKLEGKHPDVSKLVKVIPNDCLMCHGGHSKKVPAFKKLIHRIHLTGGKDNHFISHYQAQCTHCHKLDANTGTWSIGSGMEVTP
jgi:hypothetical protein